MLDIVDDFGQFRARKSKRCHQDLYSVTNIQKLSPTLIREHDDVANIIVAIFQVWNNVNGVTVEFIESEYDKVIYQAFIKPRNK